MGQNRVAADAEHVWQWIAEHCGERGAAFREVFEGVKGRLKRSDCLRRAIAMLVEHGFAGERPVAPRVGPAGSPSPKCEVNR